MNPHVFLCQDWDVWPRVSVNSKFWVAIWTSVAVSHFKVRTNLENCPDEVLRVQHWHRYLWGATCLLHQGRLAEPCAAHRGKRRRDMEKLHKRARVCAHLMDECFNFPPLESLMGDEPKVACKVRCAHQTHRQDGGETGTPAERKPGRWRGHEVSFSKHQHPF